MVVKRTAFILTTNAELKDSLELILQGKAAGELSVQRARNRDDLLSRLGDCKSPRSIENIVLLDGTLAINAEELLSIIRGIKQQAGGIPVILLNGPQEYIEVGADLGIYQASVYGEAKLGSLVQACLENLRRWRDNFASSISPELVDDYRGRTLLLREQGPMWGWEAHRRKRFRNVFPGVVTLVSTATTKELPIVFKRGESDNGSSPEVATYALLHRLQGRLIPQQFGNDERLLALQQIGDNASFGANSLDDLIAVQGIESSTLQLLELVDSAARMYYAGSLCLLEQAHPRGTLAQRSLFGVDTVELWRGLSSRFDDPSASAEPFVYGTGEYPLATHTFVRDKLLRDFWRLAREVRGETDATELRQRLEVLIDQKGNGDHFLSWTGYGAPGLVHLDMTTNNILYAGADNPEPWKIIDLFKMGVGSPLFQLAFLAHPYFVLGDATCSQEEKKYLLRRNLLGHFALSIWDAQGAGPMPSLPERGIVVDQELERLFPSYGIFESLRMMGDIVGEAGYIRRYGKAYEDDLVQHGRVVQALCEELRTSAPLWVQAVAEFITHELVSYILKD